MAVAPLRPLPDIAGVLPASQLEVRPAPAVVSSGIAEMDALTGGLPSGALTELVGPASSGRTTLLLSLMGEITRRQELCALVDVGDSFDPQSAAAAGVNLDYVLWVRCESRRAESRRSASGERQPDRVPKADSLKPKTVMSAIEQALKATDLLLQSGGFKLVVVDMGDLPVQAARRIPLTSWFRFRRAVEHTPTVLLVLEEEPCAKTCASLVVEFQQSALSHQSPVASRQQNHSPRRHGGTEDVECEIEDLESETPEVQSRKPVRSTAFAEDYKLQITNYQSHSVSPCLRGEPDSERGAAHTRIFRGLNIAAEVVRSRSERKPARSTRAEFRSRTLWAKA